MPNYGQISFGAGLVAFTPSGSNPTPIVCGVLQDVTLKMSQTTKKLYGQEKYAAAVAETESDVSGSAKFGAFYGSLIKQALAGSTMTTGQKLAAIGEQGTIGSTPYQITVTNSANWVEDLSVWDLTAGKLLTRVASSPATGQYSVSAGVYTFAAADTGHVISFCYSYSSTGGVTVSLNNQLMGAANTFTANLFNTYNGQASGVKLFSVVIPGFDMALKNNDFTMPSLTFEAYQDSLGRVLEFYGAQ